MATHHGELLRKFLAVNDISAEKLAKKMKKNKGTIYNWIKTPVFNLVQFDELKKAGVELVVEPIKQAEQAEKEYSGYSTEDLLQMVRKRDLDIERLTEMLQKQLRTNEMLAETLNQLTGGRNIVTPAKHSITKPNP